MNSKGAPALPWALDFALRLVVGLLIHVSLRLFSLVALFIELARRARGLPDPGVPLPATALVPQRIGVVAAVEAHSGDSDDDSVDAAAPDADAAPAPAPAPAGAPAGKPREVEVQHIPVDAAAGARSEAWRLVGPYLRAHGSGALCSSTLWNPEYTHMFVPGLGSQPYVVGRAYCRTIVVGVGDPLAREEDWEEMVRAFKTAFPHATYAHTGAAFSKLLQQGEFKFGVNDMGAETNIMVQQWAYGKRTRTIRNAARDARAAGVRVRELRAGDLTPAVCHQLANVTGDWVAQKAVGDSMLRVFIRHVDYGALHLEEGVRLFVAERGAPEGGGGGGEGEGTGAQVQGFVLVDPLWRGGAVYGYVTSLNRMRSDGHPGTLKLMYEEIMAVSKAEGKEVLTFGFSPFFNLQATPFFGALWVEASSRFLFMFGNNLYQFRNLAFSKARYGGSVVGDAYTDPNVTMTHVYGATHTVLVDMGMLDQYVFLMYVGFFGDLVDTLLKLGGLRATLANSIVTAAGGGGKDT